jgi:hypothetical protein
MRNRIINFIKALVAIILMVVIGLGVCMCATYLYERDNIENQEYSVEHDCVEFMSYLEEDEFGDQYINKIYHYSDGNIVEEHDYLRVEF